MKKLFIITLLALSMQSCVFVVGAAAGAAGAVVVYDHRKLERIREDQRANTLILQRLTGIPGFRENAHINSTTFNHVTLLTGEALTQEIRDQAGQVAHSVEGVTRVYNEINIMGPSSALSRTSDSWITAKIKTQMLAMKNLKASSIKVVTESGVVYLMGSVSREQAENAVDIARKVSGVQKVIKIFQYTDGNVATSNSAETSGLGQSQQISENTTTTSPQEPATNTLAANTTAADNSTKLLNQDNSSSNVVYSN